MSLNQHTLWPIDAMSLPMISELTLLVRDTSVGVTSWGCTHYQDHDLDDNRIKMYFTWAYGTNKVSISRPKTNTEHTPQKRDRRINVTELVSTFKSEICKLLSPLSLSEVLP